MDRIHWIIKADNDKQRNAQLLYACGGDQKSAHVLQVLVYIASTQENKSDISLEKTTSFTIRKLPLDNLLAIIERKARAMSKGTLRTRLLDLQSRKYISIDGYHQSYIIYHHVIQEAFSSEVDKLVSRKRGPGRPRRETQENKLVSQDANEKTKLISEENKIDFYEERIKALEDGLKSAFIVIKMYEKRFENIEKTMHDAGFTEGEKTKLLSEKTKLLSLESSEEACKEDGDGKKEPVILYNTIYNTNPLPPTPMRRVGRTNKSQKEEKPTQPQLPATRTYFLDSAINNLWMVYRAQLEALKLTPPSMTKDVREKFITVYNWFKERPEEDFIAYFEATNAIAKEKGNVSKYATPGWLAVETNFNNWQVSYRPIPASTLSPSPSRRELGDPIELLSEEEWHKQQAEIPKKMAERRKAYEAMKAKQTQERVLQV